MPLNVNILDWNLSELAKLTIESNNLKTFSNESLESYIFLAKIDNDKCQW